MNNDRPPLIFRYCFELDGVIQRDSMSLIEGMIPLKDDIEEHEQKPYRKIVISRGIILEALDNEGVSNLTSIKYYDNLTKVWR